MASPVMANDETGARIAGERFWFHGATTETLTLVTCHKRRGRLGMEDAGVLAEFKGVSVHDRYPQYWLFPCEHAACHAHLIRDLAAVADRSSQKPWAAAMAKLLLDAKDKADRAREAGKASLSKRQLGRIAKDSGTLQWLKRGKSLDEPWTLYPIGTEPTVHRIRFADIDGSGKPHLLVAPLFRLEALACHAFLPKSCPCGRIHLANAPPPCPK